MADEPANEPADEPANEPAGEPADEPSSEGDEGSDWRKHARTWEARAKQAQREIDELKKANQTDAEKAVEKARKEGREEAAAEALAGMVETTLEAIAAEKLAHPADVRLLEDYADRIDLFVKDGKPDRKTIGKALDDLVKKRPELGKAGSRTTPLRGGAERSSAGGFDMNDEIRRRAGR